MMDVKILWPSLKNKLTEYSLVINYIDQAGNYYLFVEYQGFQLVCRIVKGSEDSIDFETYYKNSAILII